MNGLLRSHISLVLILSVVKSFVMVDQISRRRSQRESTVLHALSPPCRKSFTKSARGCGGRTRTPLSPSRRALWALGWAEPCRRRRTTQHHSPGAGRLASARTRGRRVRGSAGGARSGALAFACVMSPKMSPSRVLLRRRQHHHHLVPLHLCLVHHHRDSAWRTSIREVSDSREWTHPTCLTPSSNLQALLRRQRQSVRTVPTSSRRTCAVSPRALWRLGPAVRQGRVGGFWFRLRHRPRIQCP